MNASKKMRNFRIGLVLALSLLLWHPLQGIALAQQGGGIPPGITMKAVSGKVVQTMDSGGYTYALVEKDGDSTWVALPKSKLSVGDEISCRSGMVMNNFSSRSLGRTFEHIVFSGGLLSPGAATAQQKTAALPKTTELSKAEGANAYTIGELFTMKSSLAGKPVVVRARVVKVTGGIMGKNWLHLQDGTGSQADGTNDLVVTTDSSQSKVGDLVTIKGNLSVDRDFGSNYKYAVIVEGAEVAGQ